MTGEEFIRQQKNNSKLEREKNKKKSLRKFLIIFFVVFFILIVFTPTYKYEESEKNEYFGTEEGVVILINKISKNYWEIHYVKKQNSTDYTVTDIYRGKYISEFINNDNEDKKNIYTVSVLSGYSEKDFYFIFSDHGKFNGYFAWLVWLFNLETLIIQ